jgi:protein-glutamine gamma-glutamyltransferase
MSLPPLLAVFALLFWGWETRHVLIAVIGAVALELPRLMRWRWDFSEKDMRRVWDFCTLLFIGAAVYSFAATDLVNGPMRFLPWLPVIFFPFAVAAAYSATDSVRLSAYFLLLRRKRPTAAPSTPLGWFVPYWYLVICLVAASTANMRDLRFYAGVVVLSTWWLWTTRSRTAPVWSWAVVLLVVAAAGYQGHIGLSRLQSLLENKAGQIFEDMISTDVELTQTRTAIGAVGKLKSSGQIILRLQTDGLHSPPEYLRKASFTIYQCAGNRAVWSVADVKFAPVAAGPEPATWAFGEARPPTSAVTISMYLMRGMGILPVPNGPVALDELLAGEVQTNRCGSVRVRDSLPLTRYVVKYTDASTLDAPPSAADLAIPEEESPVIARLAAELNLAGQPPAEALRRIADFFQTKFTYSTYLKTNNYDPTGRNTPLSQFLLQTRAGHCEYFATATTLLLRRAGIPARYATGFAVPEEGGSSRVYVVRSRHAHAWALAHVNGTWQDFDTTPGGWEAVEKSQKSIFEPLSDFFSALRYHFTYWRYFGDRTAVARFLVWPAGVALLWFGWRLLSKKNRVRRKDRELRESLALVTGHDSEFYLIENRLSHAGFPRRNSEPLGEWLARLETAQPLPPLREIVLLHSAYRFDPQGITAEQRRDLRSQVERWLKDAASASSAASRM